MKLSTREDIAAPIEAVFAQVADFDGYERAALRRGAEVVRTDALTVPGVGMSWRSSFEYRGRQRKANMELAEYDPPNGLLLMVHSAGVEIEVVVELVAMSRARTRLAMSLEARPRSIPARLLIQSLKLARTNVLKRYRKRVAEFAAEVEDRCRAEIA